MKKVAILLCGIIVVAAGKAYSQLDSLFTLYVSHFDSAGFAYYNPGTLEPGDAFSIYEAMSGDTVNSLILIESFEDSVLHMQHDHYQQTFKGIKVEAAELIEHSDSGYVVFMNGKLVADLDGNPIPSVSEADAIETLLSGYPDNYFAWMDVDWEAQLQGDMQDTNATFFPTGELLWALEDFDSIAYLIPGSQYRLAWRFELLSLMPYFHKAFFVDAGTGAIFRKEDLDRNDGDAAVWINGTLTQLRTIDTYWAGSITKHILRANDNGRNIHTKPNAGAWGAASNYRDGDDLWTDADDKIGATVHWFISESWDYFSSAPYNRNGFDGLGSELRVRAEYIGYQDTITSRWSKHSASNQHYIDFGKTYEYGKAVDVAGHEFVHAIIDAAYMGGEARAIEESLCDIFGELIESKSENGPIDWVHGADPGNLDTRSLSNPNSDGIHYGSSCNISVGQPDTYWGLYWSTDTCGDPHVNAGVHNYWFYLLSEGGTGINDNSDTFVVSGIGADDAALIAYQNLTTTLTGAVRFWDARQASITNAELLFGNCSFQHIQTANAWHAVGMGNPSTCPATSSSDPMAISLSLKIFPNPSVDIFVLDFSGNDERKITVHNILGELIQDYPLTKSDVFEVDLQSYPAGLYILSFSGKKGEGKLKLIKQ